MKVSDIENGIYHVLDYIDERVNRALSKEIKISVGDVLAAAFGISIILILLAVVFATGFFVATYINKESVKLPPPSSSQETTPSSNAVSNISTNSLTFNPKDLTPKIESAEVKSVVEPVKMAMSPSLSGVKGIINSTINVIQKPTSLHICNATEVMSGLVGISCKYGERGKNICYSHDSDEKCGSMFCVDGIVVG